MINKDALIQSFHEIIGWPYSSPGSNDARGIDCSGAFVRAYKAQGQSIYHGCNRIVRAHCRGVTAISSASQLEPGMAVFKSRTDLANLSNQYKPGGKYYSDAMLYDFYHIGLVVSVSPLKIIHATTPNAKMDTKLGSWAWCGYLTAVDYEDNGQEGKHVDTHDTIRNGAKGATVIELQGLLIRAGYPLPRFGADGSYGNETVEAVKAFQRNHGFAIDGICGPKTWAALDRLVPDPEGATLYTVTISGMSYNQAWDVAEQYNGTVSAG